MQRHLILLPVPTWAGEICGRIHETSAKTPRKLGSLNDLTSRELASTLEEVCPPPNMGKLPLSEPSPTKSNSIDFRFAIRLGAALESTSQ